MNTFSYSYQAPYLPTGNFIFLLFNFKIDKINKIFNKLYFLAELFLCEYCPESFPTKLARISHTIVHFTNRTCSNCNQTLIRINDEWYALHNSVKCDKENCFISENDPTLRLNEFKEEIELNDECIDSIKNFDSESESIDEKLGSPLLLIPDLLVESDSKNKRSKRPPRKKVKKRHTKPEKTIEPIEQIEPIEEFNESPDQSTEATESTEKPNVKKREPATKFMDHRPKASLICDICQKVLATYNTLKAHMYNMHIPRVKERFQCTECDLTLANAGTLKAHMRIHAKSKAFVCTYCGKGFNQLYNLKQHTNGHTGQKPFKCTMCDKAFGRKTNLVAHTRVHTGEKPFKCPIDGCDRAYMFEIDLKRHKYSVHGIYTKKHICPICSKVYSENKLLKKHLESHGGFS